MNNNLIAKRLVTNLPDYERKSKLIQEILYAMALEFASMEKDELLKNNELFIDTAIKALQLHARDLGITLESNLNLKEQRELIVAYYRAALEQTNEETIKNVASSFSGGTVEVKSTDTDGIFCIKFVDTLGVPSNLDGLKNALDTIIPAHLQFIFEYSYLIIRDLSKMTLIELENMTLDKFAGGN